MRSKFALPRGCRRAAIRLSAMRSKFARNQAKSYIYSCYQVGQAPSRGALWAGNPSPARTFPTFLPDQEMSAIQRPPVIEPETKLKAVRQGAKYAFPTANIERMLSEIERGYRG